MSRLELLFGRAGALLAVLAAGAALFGTQEHQGEMIHACALGIAALASFKTSEFFSEK